MKDSMVGSPHEQFEYNLITTLCYWLASLSTGLCVLTFNTWSHDLLLISIDCERHLTTWSRHRSLRDSAERCFLSERQGHFTRTTTSNIKYLTFCYLQLCTIAAYDLIWTKK